MAMELKEAPLYKINSLYSKAILLTIYINYVAVIGAAM